MEIWKDIDGYNGLYQVSDLGRVRRIAYSYQRYHLGSTITVPITEKILGGTKLTAKGYPRVNLNDKVCFIHSLVARAFIPNLLNKPQVNHIDGNKLNNAALNLEWVTNQENRDHAVKHDLVARRGKGLGKLTWDQIRIVQQLHREGKLQKDIATIYGITQQTVSKLLKVEKFCIHSSEG